MNWIEKMIAEQCPNGVKYVKLGEVFNVQNGYTPSKSEKSFWENGVIPWFRLEDIRTNGRKLTDAIQHITPSAVKKSGVFKAGSIIISTTATIGEYALVDCDFVCNQQITCLTPLSNNTNSHFFLHYSAFIGEWCRQKVSGVGLAILPTSKLKECLIPLPPLSIQEEIVSVLDKFSELIEKTDEEIALRQKQYEYYREKLLTFEKGEVEWKKIPDVAKYSTGLTYKPANVTDNGTLVLRSSNIKDGFLAFDDNVYVTMDIPERAKVKKGDILICVRNGSKKLVGKCAIITEEADGMAFGAFMNILRAEKCDNKYLFYVWQKDSTVKQYKGDDASPICQITNKDFSRITIPIPSLSRQQEIVETLDKFETLISKLKEERELRQKQYEYYREKLLTF